MQIQEGNILKSPFWPEKVRVISAKTLGESQIKVEAVGLETNRFYMINPLPHQIDAVYHHILLNPRIRFLLADDPGAGKTIMAGLLLKELKYRGLVEIRNQPYEFKIKFGEVQREYAKISFDKERAFKAQAEFVAMGHPLLEAVINSILILYAQSGADGAAFIDPEGRKGGIIWFLEIGEGLENYKKELLERRQRDADIKQKYGIRSLESIDKEIEELWMDIAMAYESSHGRTPENVSTQNLGYDIRSQDDTENYRYIEVKARQEK